VWSEDFFLSILDEPRSKYDVYWSVLGLRKVGSIRSIPILVTFLTYPMQDVKCVAILTIAHIGGASVTPLFADALLSPNYREKTYAMWAILDVRPDAIFDVPAQVFAPCALGGAVNPETIGRIKARVIAGGANNQLATPEDGERLHARGILYAPDYVINAGGIINVCTEYLGDGDASLVRKRIEGIPSRLEQIWSESKASGRDPAAVADAMAQRLIGRG